MKENQNFYFLLLSVFAAIGIGNMWIFPNSSLKFSGIFFIAYIIGILLIGIPLLIMEFSVGQYINKDVVGTFSSVAKRFGSVGWLMLINSFLLLSVLAVVLSWHIIYVIVSFGLKWKTDARLYFFNRILEVATGLNSFDIFPLSVFAALIAAWVIIFFTIRKGHESVRKFVFIAAQVFLVLLIVFLVYPFSLSKSLVGIYSFLEIDPSQLLNPALWIASFSAAILTLGIGFGVFSAFARKSKDAPVIGYSSITAFFQLIVGIMVVLITAGIAGFLSTKKYLPLELLSSEDVSYPFTVLSSALPYFYSPTIASALFFILLSLFVIFGASSLAYLISNILVHRFEIKYRNAAIIISGFGFLLGLLFVIKPGYYIMDLVMHFFYYNIIFALLLQCLVIGWSSKSTEIADGLNSKSSLKIGSFWRLWLKYAVPVFLIALIAVQLRRDFIFGYNRYPLWSLLGFGLGTFFIPLLTAFSLPKKLM
ncbi:MAG TPA: hypothetical protein VI564_04545 [Candidatus Nanoarchaeia archaeon]|nr:hypothetical protein [Candidatus Nanoarchaeia archaeon]